MLNLTPPPPPPPQKKNTHTHTEKTAGTGIHILTMWSFELLVLFHATISSQIYSNVPAFAFQEIKLCFLTSKDWIEINVWIINYFYILGVWINISINPHSYMYMSHCGDRDILNLGHVPRKNVTRWYANQPAQLQSLARMNFCLWLVPLLCFP